MSLVIVGSVAFDTIRTPWGDREKIVGGSGTYCSLAASYFTRPRIVGVVGRDFPRKTIALLRSRGVDLAGLKVKAGKTFHWEGKYEDDPNRRTTLRTELNVFADFRPEVPAPYRGSRIVYLANLNPEHHDFILGQFRKPALVAMDTIRLWIDTKREALLKELGRVDIYFANDERPTSSPPARPSSVSAHRSSSSRRASMGRSSSAMISFSAPWPTRASTSSTRPGPGTASPAAFSAISTGRRASPAATSAGPRSTAASWPRSRSRTSGSAGSCPSTGTWSKPGSGSSAG